MNLNNKVTQYICTLKILGFTWDKEAPWWLTYHINMPFLHANNVRIAVTINAIAPNNVYLYLNGKVSGETWYLEKSLEQIAEWLDDPESMFSNT